SAQGQALSALVLAPNHDDHPRHSLFHLPSDQALKDMKKSFSRRLIITGAAGLVGQNLITRLKARGYVNIVGIDKHAANVAILRKLHPDITIIEADLARPGSWQAAIANGGTLILNHAQISALEEKQFIDNNVTATELVLEAARAASIDYIVHISSSVVNSMAV